MSDKLSPIAEPVTGFALRFDSQYALLAEGVKELRKSGIFKPGLERAISSLLVRGGATSLAKMPQLLSRLSRNRQLGSLLTDIRGETLLANKAFFELTGYKLGDTTSGENFGPEMYEFSDGRLFRTKRLVPWLDAARSLSLVSTRYSITDGTRGERIRWMQFCSQPLVADNRLEGVFTVVADATEEVEIESRIQSVIGVLEAQMADLSTPVARLNSLIDRVHELNDFLPRETQRRLYTPGFSAAMPDPTARAVEDEPVSVAEIEELVALSDESLVEPANGFGEAAEPVEIDDDSRADFNANSSLEVPSERGADLEAAPAELTAESDTFSGSTYESVLLAQAASEIAALEEIIQESAHPHHSSAQPEIIDQDSSENQENHFDPVEPRIINEQIAEAVAENLYLDFSTDTDNGHGPTLQENEVLPAAYMDEIAEDVVAELHGEAINLQEAVDGNLEVELMARAALEADTLTDDEYEPTNLEHIFDPESETQLWNEFSDFSTAGFSESLALGSDEDEDDAENDQADDIREESREPESFYIQDSDEIEIAEEAELMSAAEIALNKSEVLKEPRYSSAPEDLIQNLARTLTDLPVIGPDALTVQAEEIELVADNEKFEAPAHDAVVLAETISEPESIHAQDVDNSTVEESVEISESEPETREPVAPALSVTIIPESAEVLRAKRALVVDDIPVNVKLLVLQLKRLGYTTDTASNGRDALEALGRNQYDIVFMDCDMPVMDGYEATREIRRREIVLGTHMPIVAMTSYERTADKEKCAQAGMDDCLVKGMHATAVSAVIERINAKSDEHLDQFQSTSSAPAIDFESLDNALEAAGHSQEELNEMVRMFMRSMETFVGSMQRAIDSKDGDLVIELASSIKGPSASLGLKPLTKVIQEVLTFAEAQDWPQVRLKYLKLKTAYLRSLDQLKKMCPSLFVEEAHRIG